jgi:hypothetical protein
MRCEITFNSRYQTYVATGFKGTIKAQQPAHKRSIPANITKAIFHPNFANKTTESGPNVIEPIPVPAVTIPKNKTLDSI